MKYGLIILLFYFFSGISFSQLFYQNPVPTINSLRDIDFFDEQNGIITGMDKTILHTTDGGSNWKELINVPNNQYLGLVCLNAQSALLCGENGKIAKTTNQGISWYEIQSTAFSHLISFSFYNERIGAVVDYGGGFLVTNDGGENWQRAALPFNTGIFSIAYWDSLKISALTHNGILFNTTDNGNHWSIDSSLINMNVKKIEIINNSTAIALTGYKNILITRDGGISWKSRTVSSNSSFLDICFASGSLGYILSWNKIFRTTDGCTNWTEVHTFSNSPKVNKLFLKGNKILIIGEYGFITSSIDRGNVWRDLSFNVFENYDFGKYLNKTADSLIIILSHRGKVLKTTNHGRNWLKTNTVTSDGLWDVYFKKNNLEGVYSSYNVISKTTDGGINWLKTNHNLNYLYVCYKTGEDLISVTTQGDVYEKKGNQNFQLKYSLNFSCNDVAFFDSLHGIITGDDGKIAYTGDGGSTWTIESIGYPSLYTISIVDENTGFISTNSHFFLKTTDAGNTWINISHPEGNYVHNNFFNKMIGAVWGGGNKYCITNDGGTTWDCKMLPTNISPLMIKFVDAEEYYVLGSYGLIMNNKYESVVEVKENSFKPVYDFLLYQNYPNPFNPSTKIRYSIPGNGKGETGKVLLKIFDVLGREIQTLVNKEQSPGTYEIEFNGSTLSSGVYFYRLEAGDFVSTKKMIVLK